PAQPPPTTRRRSAKLVSMFSASRISLTFDAATGVINTRDSGPGASLISGFAKFSGFAKVGDAVAATGSDIWAVSWPVPRPRYFSTLRQHTLPSREGHGNLPRVLTFD